MVISYKEFLEYQQFVNSSLRELVIQVSATRKEVRDMWEQLLKIAQQVSLITDALRVD